MSQRRGMLRRVATQVLAPVARGRRAPDVEVNVLDVLAERLAGVDRPRVAVLVDRSPSGAVQAVRRAQPQATVVKVGVRGGQSDLHARLAAGGPYEVVLDRTRKPEVRGRRFKSAFFHLVPGGSYIAEGHVEQEAMLEDQTKSKTMSAVLARIAQARAAVTPASGQRRRDNAALADAVESITTVGDHLVVVNRAKALAKLTEEEANQVLEIRGGPDRVLHTVPGARFASRCTFSSSTGRRPERMLEVYDAPPASLREYHHAVCVPGQVLTTDHLLLPDTYRHNRQRRLKNSHTEELGLRFAALEQEVDDARILEGTYFYLDNEIRGHFGHAMTEQLSRLWALPLARELAPDLKAVLAVNRRRKLEPFEFELYGAAGLAPEELVLVRRPRRVERLLSATPMFCMPAYVHPEIQHTWRQVGDALAARATMRPDMDRIFISRRIRKRACLNTPEVEEVFARHGFTILYPEDYPMADQVAIFRRARVIAGFAGSGLFNICFTTEPKQVVMLQHEAYTATNEYLMASVLGHELISIVSDIDRTEEEELGNASLFQSSFTVDFDREGRHLLRTLAEL